MPVTSKPWDGSKSRFSVDQLLRAVPRAVADWAKSKASDEGREVSKNDLKLPFKEPDGTINLNGISAALGAISGARGQGVDLPSDVKAAARQELEKERDANRGKEESEKAAAKTKILEFAMTQPRKAKVDHEKGIIQDVHFCGLESLNGYDYLADGLSRAVEAGKYNGVPIWDLHPTKDEIARGEVRRGMGDHVGVSYESRFEADTGVWGNLRVNKATELGRSLLWNAEHNPRGFGLSHEALVSEPERVDGRDRLCVKDVDVVECMVTCPDPATTKGLFESVNQNKGAAVLKSDSEPMDKGAAEEIEMNAAEIKKLITESIQQETAKIFEGLQKKAEEDAKDAKIKTLEAELEESRKGQREADFKNDLAKLTVEHNLTAKESEFLTPSLKSMEDFGAREKHVKSYRELNPAGARKRATTSARDPLSPFSESFDQGAQHKIHEFAEVPMTDSKAKAVGESLKTGADLPAAK